MDYYVEFQLYPESCDQQVFDGACSFLESFVGPWPNDIPF